MKNVSHLTSEFKFPDNFQEFSGCPILAYTCNIHLILFLLEIHLIDIKCYRL